VVHMPQRFRAILLVLALAAAPAYAQTPTTTGTPTTSTTITGSVCRPDQTLCPIDVRLAAFRDTVNVSPLGRLRGPIDFRLQQGEGCLIRATALCDGRLDADANRARRKLQRCIRPLAIVQAKIRSRRADRIIPSDLAAALAFEADGLASDLKAARESLTCP
jgi:hypothetical protein